MSRSRTGTGSRYLLFPMELKNRLVHFSGYTNRSSETCLKKITREPTDYQNGFMGIGELVFFKAKIRV